MGAFTQMEWGAYFYIYGGGGAVLHRGWRSPHYGKPFKLVPCLVIYVDFSNYVDQVTFLINC